MKWKRNDDPIVEAEQMKLIQAEDERKELLCDAFDELIDRSHRELADSEGKFTKFEEFYSGRAIVSSINTCEMFLELEDDSIVGPLHATPRLDKHLALERDDLFLEIGKHSGKWWLWNLMAVGSSLRDLLAEEKRLLN